MILIIAGSIIIVYSYNYSSGAGSVSPSSSDSAPISLVSQQWAGYVDMTNLLLRQPEVTAVSGSWIVPSVTAILNDTYSSLWVGIGGYGEKSLIQTGTTQQSVDGITSYYAWYEALPRIATTIQNFVVMPGDEITASITLLDGNTHLWSIQLTDLTSGANFLLNITYRSSRLSAEWIVEAPSLNDKIMPLANFGNVTFSDCTATISNSTGPISSFPGYQLIMHDSQDKLLANVSPLRRDGSSFSVAYSDTNSG